MKRNYIYNGDCLEILKTLPENSIDCCVTSPPYYALRDYGIEGQLGLENTPEEYIAKMTEVFMEVYRVLKPEGTLWLNIGDTYNGNKVGNTEIVKHKRVAEGSFFRKKMWCGAKNKDILGIPWMLAFSLRNAGWYLRQDIIWNKPNGMPDGATDRCTKSHEYIFLMSKRPNYYFDNKAILEESVGGGYKNKRDVWSVNTKHCKDAHFATYPPDLVKPCVLAGCPEGGIVLDPFIGSGTTALVARALGRDYIGIELNPEYKAIAERRIEEQIGLFQ